MTPLTPIRNLIDELARDPLRHVVLLKHLLAYPEHVAIHRVSMWVDEACFRRAVTRRIIPRRCEHQGGGDHEAAVPGVHGNNKDNAMATRDGPYVAIALIPEMSRWDAQRQLVRAVAVTGHDGRRISCLISREAIETIERAVELDEAECVAAVTRHCNRLAAAAAHRLALYGRDPGNVLRITSSDVHAARRAP